LSGRGLCDELITRPEESYRLWCVVVCDQETSRMRRPWPALSSSDKGGDFSKEQCILPENDLMIETRWSDFKCFNVKVLKFK